MYKLIFSDRNHHERVMQLNWVYFCDLMSDDTTELPTVLSCNNQFFACHSYSLRHEATNYWLTQFLMSLPYGTQRYPRRDPSNRRLNEITGSIYPDTAIESNSRTCFVPSGSRLIKQSHDVLIWSGYPRWHYSLGSRLSYRSESECAPNRSFLPMHHSMILI